MKKSKKILSAILCVAALTSAFAFTACGGNGGNNGGNQTEGGGNQPENEPVTTVANEQEWKNALDVFSLDSFTLYETSNYEDMLIPITGNIDMVNYKANFVSDIEWANRYYEYSNNKFWEYGGIYDAEGTVVEAAAAKEYFKGVLTNLESNRVIISLPYLHIMKYVTEAGKTDYKTIPELFTEFTYQEGNYISKPFYIEGMSTPANVKIAIKDGVLSEFELSIAESQTFTYKVTLKISNVNSTTVTTPAEARTAIDAEIAKG